MTKKKQTKPKIQGLQKKVRELEQNWLRALADYKNLEKRIKKQKSDFTKFANASLIDKLLIVLDDLDRAVDHVDDTPGIQLIRDQLRDILTSEAVSEIKAKGQNFDPNSMDCVEMVKGPKNKVAKVVLKGYKYHDRVLRPARVKVGNGSTN